MKNFTKKKNALIALQKLTKSNYPCIKLFVIKSPGLVFIVELLWKLRTSENIRNNVEIGLMLVIFVENLLRGLVCLNTIRNALRNLRVNLKKTLNAKKITKPWGKKKEKNNFESL